MEYSDIDLASWKDYDDILTGSLWDFPSRQKANGHKLDYHGNFIPQIAYQIFSRYTKADDIVIDWFLGSGTSAIEAVNQNRRLIGVELKSELAQYVREKLPEDALGSKVIVVNGDSASDAARDEVRQALGEMGAQCAQLAILHPPYADIIKFSELDEDLSNCCDTNAFIEGFAKVAKNAFDTLQPGRFAVLIIGDKYCGGELDPLGFKCMQAMNDVGFRTKSIVVKNIEGNEKAKGRDSNLWRYRALAGGFYIFKHEYVIVMFKPT